MINPEVLLSYSAWILPPVVGALIGYITNDIAIKMLFRPLKAKHIGPVRIPFTPGIIPRQREKLAESIALMVSRELITEDAIRRQISSPAFQRTLSSRVSDFTGFLLYTSFSELQEKFRQGRLNAAVQTVHTAAYPESTTLDSAPADTLLIQSVLSAFFRSESFFLALQKSVALALDQFFRLPLNVLCGQNGDRLSLFFSRNLRIESLRPPLRQLAGDLVEDGIQRNKSLEKILTPQATEGIIKAINRIYPAAARELLQFLRTPHIHKTLEKKGRTVLRKTISRLSSLQRLFIVAGQYDRNIEQQMDEIVDDLLEQLETAIADEETRDKLLDTLEGWLKRLRTHTVADIAGVWGESLPDDVRRGVDALFHLAASPKAVSWMQGLVQRLLEKYGEQEVGTVLEEFTGHSTEQISIQIADWISSLVKEVEGTGSTAIHFFKTLFHTLSNSGANSLAEILQLEQQHKQRLDTALEGFIVKLLDEQVPSILESVDIRTLVIDKINSLDIEKVEELILIVIRTHLRWIILFGALLGFMIGAVQVGLIKFL
jgi:uncharacterized membrane protein YheB (UPF0754 family)